MLGHSRLIGICTLAAVMGSTVALVAQQPPPGPPPAGGRQGGFPRPPRAAAPQTATGTASIAGRILAAESGRPLKRARVVVAGGGRPRVVTTDEQGRYRITGLPAGTYTITATKTGFVDAAFGQRRALRSGTPLDLRDGEQVADADLKLSRGGVITGQIVDEDGEPLARAMVTVLRQQYVRGEKQLTPAGTDQSDDRGQFRVFGLPPGDYFVSAAAGGPDNMFRQILNPAMAGAVEQAPDRKGYAATYYPGVISAADAGRVRLAASQELTGIDFQLQIVPLATVKGTVTGGAGMVMLIPGDGPAAGGRGGGGRGGLGALVGGGANHRAATRQDGTFSIANVTPGRYTIVARTGGGPDSAPRTAVASLVVAGEEVNVMLTPAPGVQVSGTVTLEAAGTPVPKGFAGFRVNAQPLDSVAAIPRMARPSEVAENGQFTVADVMAGRYVIRGVAPRGWMMKAVSVDGRDVTDLPIEVRTEPIGGLTVIFTDRISGLSGSVRDRRGTAAAGLTVIAFPSDDTRWGPQSRQIVTARTDQTGTYSLTSIPPGDYLVVAVEDVEQGEWFDPAFLEQVKDAATKVTIGEGEKRTQDLKAPSPPTP